MRDGLCQGVGIAGLNCRKDDIGTCFCPHGIVKRGRYALVRSLYLSTILPGCIAGNRRLLRNNVCINILAKMIAKALYQCL